MKHISTLKYFVICTIAIITISLVIYCLSNALKINSLVPITATVDQLLMKEVRDHKGGSLTGIFDISYRYEFESYRSPQITKASEPIGFDQSKTHPEIWVQEVTESTQMQVYVNPKNPEVHMLPGQSTVAGWLIAAGVALGLGALSAIVIAAVWGRGSWD